jgi:hypothetical protein
MLRAIGLSALVGLVLASTGCAPNAYVGNGIQMSSQFFGDVGFVGHGDNITILSGSKINKLSIQGNNGTFTVQDGVRIWKIEFWGKGNTVSIPADMSVRVNAIGANEIIRRPRVTVPLPQYEPLPAPTYTPPPAEPAPGGTPPAKPSAQPSEPSAPPEADVMENEPAPDEK